MQMGALIPKVWNKKKNTKDRKNNFFEQKPYEVNAQLFVHFFDLFR